MTTEDKFKGGAWFEDLIFNFIPDSTIELSGTPEEMTKNASWKAFMISTSAGIPWGPLGYLTIAPEIIAITKLQVNVVYKIAKYHGKEETVTPAIISHILATALGIYIGRTFVQKVGTRVIIKTLSAQAVRKITQQIGLKIGARVVSRIGLRWIPGVTAPLFGAFSKSQTTSIGKVAIEFFSQDIDMEEMAKCTNGHEIPAGSKFCPECGEKMNSKV